MFFKYKDIIFTVSPDSEVPLQNGTVTMSENLQMTAEEKILAQTEYDLNVIRSKRAVEYPPIADYLDGVVKGDIAQQQAYIDACRAVKAKYHKGVTP